MMLRFGPPNVERLTAKGDLKGLTDALGYEKDAAVRAAAAGALGRSGDAQSLPALVGALRDPATQVRSAVIEALASRGGEPIVEPLIGMLSDTDDAVAGAAAHALGASGDARAAAPLLAAALGERSGLREAAIAALVALGDPAAREVSQLLLSPEEAHREEARGLFSRLGDPALPALKDLMRAENRDQRWRAVEAVARIPGEGSLNTLVAALEDQDYYVRNAAQAGLAARGEEAIPVVSALLSRESLSLRTAAVETLDRIGSPRVVEPLLGMLADAPGALVRTVVVVLGKIGDARAAGPLCTLMSARNDALTRREAAQALSRIHDPSSTETLLEATADSDDIVRQCASEGLRAMGWEPGNDELGARYWASQKRWERCVPIGAPAVGVLLGVLAEALSTDARAIRSAIERIGPKGVPALLAGMDSTDKRIRSEAVALLGRLGDDEEALPAAVRALKDPDRDVRAASATAMADMDGDEVVPSLLEALEDWERDVQEAAGQSLAAAHADILPDLAMLLAAEDWHARRGAILALGYSGQPAAVDMLVPFLGSPEPNLRTTAVDALARLGLLSLDALSRVLQRDDVEVRTAAISAMVAIGDRGCVEPLLNLLWDRDAGIRQAAYQGVRKIGLREALAVDLISRLNSLYIMVCSEEEMAPDEWSVLANESLKDLVESVPPLEWVHTTVLSDLSRLHESFHRFGRGRATYSDLVAAFRGWIQQQGVAIEDWERRFFHRELLDPEAVDGADVVLVYYHG
jgi:HEAT repeat protein